MEKPDGNQSFQYTYSAKEQAELKRIRAKYLPQKEQEEDKMARLRRLDRSVTQRAQRLALIVGIIGTLIFGFGMSLAMSELAPTLGLRHDAALLYGILIGVLGGVLVSLAYPIYSLALSRARKKIAPEILRLTDELMK